MQFGILGPLEVLDAGRSVELGPPKQRAVLAALLISANRVVSLDRLIDDLWGRAPPAAATGTLQAYVANLRRILEPDRAPRTPAQVLVTRTTGYLLRVEPDQVDAARFESLVREGHDLLAEARPRAAHEALTNAVGLWRGGVLSDVAGHDFVTTEATRLGELRLQARESLAQAALAVARHAEIVPELEALVGEAPLRERPRELLMLALYRCGRQADALGLMADTRALLAEELGVDPGPGLHALHTAVLRQDPKLNWPPPAPEPDPPRAHAPLPARERASPAATRPGLVGREAPLHQLRTALDGVLAGVGRVVLVVGEAGIGKTRLLEELASSNPAGGVEAAWGRCPETEDAPPFWPWTQILRTLTASRPPDHLAAAARVAGPHLSPLAPDLVEAPASAAEAGGQHARFLLYDAATRLLVELAARRPMLLIVEDLHWADPASLGLLTFLAAQLASAPILLVASVRTGEVDPDHPLAAATASLARVPSIERIELRGLGEPEVARMVVAATGATIDTAMARAIHERTEGNPFFITELARLLRSEHQLTEPGFDPTRWPIPEGVRDVLRRRLARLPEQSVSLLTIGAVTGRRFDLEVLTQVSGLDEDRALTAVEAAVMTGLLVEHPTIAGQYRFMHALVRETLQERLSGLRRARLHARITEALHGSGDVDALAHHAWHAGPALPAPQALTHILAAAGAAERALAYERAIEQLQRAVSLIGRLQPGPDTDERELDVQLSLANLLALTRGHTTSGVETAFARVRELATARSHVRKIAEALWGLAAARCIAADFPTAEAHAHELMTLAHDTGDREILLAAHHMLGAFAWHQGKHQEADPHLVATTALADEDRAERMSLLIEDPAASTRGFHSAVRWLLGDPAGARALRSEALAISAAGNHPFTKVFTLFYAAHLAVYERDPDATRRWATEAIMLSGEHGFAMFAGMCEVLAGWAAALQGEPGAARIAAAQQAIDASGTRMLRHFFLGLRAEAELAEGRPDDACRSLDEAFAEVAATGECFYEPQLHDLRAALA